MRYRPQAWLVILAVWCVPTGLWAQNQSALSSAAASPGTGTAVKQPVRKPDQVTTDDPIGLLAVRRAPRVVPASAPPLTVAAQPNTKTDSANNQAMEIAALERQLKDKQKKIALLMKLFVNDEKDFLKNGGASESSPLAQERRRYEQDELLWETAELAKCKAQLEELKSQAAK